MRIGIMAEPPGELGTVDDQLPEVVKAEQDGFDSYWFDTGPNEPITIVALAGRETERIELGTGIVQTYPRHPTVMAQQALTAQTACNGRFTLGLGPATERVIEGSLGLEFSSPARHMREYVTLVRALAMEKQVEFNGRFFNVSAGNRIAESRPFPIILAALGPLMLRVAGEVADGTITWLVGPKGLRSHIVPRITEAAEAAGRDRPRIVVDVPIVVTDDVAPARERALAVYDHYGASPHYRRMLDIEGVERPGEMAVIGDEAFVEDELNRLAEAGADDLLANITPPSPTVQSSTTRTWEFLASMVGKV